MAFYIVGMVLFILAFVFGMVVCCIERKRWAFTASLFAYFAGMYKLIVRYIFIKFKENIIHKTTEKQSQNNFKLNLYDILMSAISAFAVAVAIAFFHGAEYLERNKIQDSQIFYLNWGQVCIFYYDVHVLHHSQDNTE